MPTPEAAPVGDPTLDAAPKTPQEEIKSAKTEVVEIKPLLDFQIAVMKAMGYWTDEKAVEWGQNDENSLSTQFRVFYETTKLDDGRMLKDAVAENPEDPELVAHMKRLLEPYIDTSHMPQ